MRKEGTKLEDGDSQPVSYSVICNFNSSQVYLIILDLADVSCVQAENSLRFPCILQSSATFKASAYGPNSTSVSSMATQELIIEVEEKGGIAVRTPILQSHAITQTRNNIRHLRYTAHRISPTTSTQTLSSPSPNSSTTINQSSASFPTTGPSMVSAQPFQPAVRIHIRITPHSTWKCGSISWPY